MPAHKGQKKVGGRKKGTPNKATAGLKAAFQEHEEELVKGLLALTKSDDEHVSLGEGWVAQAQAFVREHAV